MILDSIIQPEKPATKQGRKDDVPWIVLSYAVSDIRPVWWGVGAMLETLKSQQHL